MCKPYLHFIFCHIFLFLFAGFFVAAQEPETAEPGTEAGELKSLTVSGIEYRFRWCPSGAFMMGSPSGAEDREEDETEHLVELSCGFWLLETEVTQEMWEDLMGTTVSEQRNKANPNWPLYGEGPSYPMYFVSWYESVEFCEKLSTRFGVPVRLPTEAEWEYACRAGSSDIFSFGTELSGSQANCGGAAAKPAGSYPANAWGLRDMHGNVWEWCSDWYGKESYTNGTSVDPAGPASGQLKVNRGGSWNYTARSARSANRNSFGVSYRNNFLGFRVVLVPQNR